MNDSFLNSANAPYVAELFFKFKEDPNSIDKSWSNFFKTTLIQNGHVYATVGFLQSRCFTSRNNASQVLHDICTLPNYFLAGLWLLLQI